MSPVTSLEFSNPFPGLRPYEYSEYSLFFGRDGQSAEILSRLQRKRFVAVIGISGSGKSSLIRAGLLPFLDAAILPEAGSHWRKAIFRPGNNPTKNLAAELVRPGILGAPDKTTVDPMDAKFLEATLRSGGLGLVKAVQQAHLAPHENVLIIVDQMEELFRFAKLAEEERRPHQEDEASAFVKLLLEATRQSAVPIYVVITMRSDFIGDCARFRDLPETVNEGLYLIPRMNRDQRREAIVGPVTAHGQAMAPRLVNRLLNDVSDSPDQLPLLQHALMRTYDRWAHDHAPGEPVDLRHYESIGGVAEALSRHASEIYESLPTDRHREIAKRMFQCLTEKGLDNRETRRPCRISEIMARTGASFSDVLETMQPFRSKDCSFLMPPPDHTLDANSLVDISHESLINGWTQLNKWVDDEAQSAAVFRRLADTAVLHEAREAGLYHDPDLQIALTWRDRERPTEEWAHRYHPGFASAMAFLDESRTARDAQLREIEDRRHAELNRNRKIAAALSLAGLLSLAFAVFAFYQRNEAVAQRHQADTARNNAIESAKQAALQSQISAKMAEERNKAAEQAIKAEGLAKADEEHVRNLLQQQKETSVLLAKEKQNAVDALTVAQEKEADATRAAEKFRLEALRAKESLVDDQNQLTYLSTRLIYVAPPLVATYGHRRKGLALAKVGNHEQAAKELSSILEVIPGDATALSSRGYEYLLLGRIDDSIKDTQKYLLDAPRSSVGHLNLGIAKAIQGDYKTATGEIREAIADYDPTDSGVYESDLAPDIRIATGHEVLVEESWEYELALHYQLAVLAAVQGDPAFYAMIKDADTAAKTKPSSTVPLYVALNWDWLHFRDRQQDYGALAVAGALWESIARQDPDFAGCARSFYLRFQDHHSRKPDPRYAAIAAWVAAELPSQNPQAPCGSVKRADDDPRDHALTARELQTQVSGKDLVKYAHVHQQLTLAIDLARRDPAQRDNLVDLLVRRADIRHSNGDDVGAREDCNEILRLHPAGVSSAFYYLAVTDKDAAEKAKHFELAYKADPSNAEVLTDYSDLLASTDLPRALELAQRAARIWSYSAPSYSRLARIQLKLNKPQDALHSVDTAISIDPSETYYYELRRDIEKALNRKPSLVDLHLAAGYRQAGDTSRRLGLNSDALAAYLKGFQALSAYVTADDPDLRFELQLSIRNVSDFLESTYATRYAVDFWHSAAASPPMAPLKETFLAESARIAKQDR